MGFAIVLGLTVLCVANYGNAFEFSGLDPSFQSKTQLKPTIKPFYPLTNQPHQGDQTKATTFGLKSVTPKPFGPSVDPFRQPYQPFQPGQFRANYQPFGPFPGYPGPVVYPGPVGYPGGFPGGYPGPAVYPQPTIFPQPAYRFNAPGQKPFGFQPFPTPAQPTFSPFKSGSPKKFNKNLPGLADFNLPGKYFQEHRIGAYHGPEFTSAIIPAEHNIKQSKPKDTLLGGKPAVPVLPEFGFSKQSVNGFAPQPSFGYPVPNFPPIQPHVSAVPSTNSAPTTTVSPFGAVTTAVDQRLGGFPFTTAVPSQDDSATLRSLEVTGEPAATPTADPQPTQEDDSVVVSEVPTDNNNDGVPAAYDITSQEKSEQSNNPTEAGEPTGVTDAGSPVTQESVKEFNPEQQEQVVVAQGDSESSGAAVQKSEQVKETPVANNPVTETGVVNLPGLPKELFPQSGAVSVSDPSIQGLFAQGGSVSGLDPSVQGLLASAGFPQYFGQSANFAQQSYFPYFDAPKFSEEELKAAYVAQFGSQVPQNAQFDVQVPQTAQVFGSANPVVKLAEGVNGGAAVPTESGVPVSNVPSAENAEKVEIGQKSESAGQVQENGEENKQAVGESRNIPEAPKKGNTVQIIPANDPFNGQLPLLFDPSNTGTPLNTYGFYNHPAVSSLSSKASLASYSPEEAFTNFGSSFRQGYLVEGSPSLTPVSRTIVQSSQTPISISSKDHPLHSQVFRFSQSFVPYPQGFANSNNAAAGTFRSIEIPSSTAAPVTVPTSQASVENVSSSTTTEAA